MSQAFQLFQQLSTRPFHASVMSSFTTRYLHPYIDIFHPSLTPRYVFHFPERLSPSNTSVHVLPLPLSPSTSEGFFLYLSSQSAQGFSEFSVLSNPLSSYLFPLAPPIYPFKLQFITPPLTRLHKVQHPSLETIFHRWGFSYFQYSNLGVNG